MDRPRQLVGFVLDERRYGVALDHAVSVIRALAPTALPEAPETVMGVFDWHGMVVPIFNTRKRMGLAERDLAPGDQLLIVREARRTVALVIDEAIGIIDYAE